VASQALTNGRCARWSPSSARKAGSSWIDAIEGFQAAGAFQLLSRSTGASACEDPSDNQARDSSHVERKEPLWLRPLQT
jgi:hypothetical protein